MDIRGWEGGLEPPRGRIPRSQSMAELARWKPLTEPERLELKGCRTRLAILDRRVTMSRRN